MEMAGRQRLGFARYQRWILVQIYRTSANSEDGRTTHFTDNFIDAKYILQWIICSTFTVFTLHFIHVHAVRFPLWFDLVSFLRGPLYVIIAEYRCSVYDSISSFTSRREVHEPLAYTHVACWFECEYAAQWAIQMFLNALYLEIWHPHSLVTLITLNLTPSQLFFWHLTPPPLIALCNTWMVPKMD